MQQPSRRLGKSGLAQAARVSACARKTHMGLSCGVLLRSGDTTHHSSVACSPNPLPPVPTGICTPCAALPLLFTLSGGKCQAVM